jgi:hypothetical protein
MEIREKDDFELFGNAFAPDPGVRNPPDGGECPGEVRLDRLLELFGGMSFDEGRYRLLTREEIPAWTERVENAFPEHRGNLICFAFDWLGRAFVLDRSRRLAGRPAVLMLEPGTGRNEDIPCDIVSFHDFELISHRGEVLADGFYSMWRAQGGSAPLMHQCAGYKHLVFQGGSDIERNLEIKDMQAYWEYAAEELAVFRKASLAALRRALGV